MNRVLKLIVCTIILFSWFISCTTEEAKNNVSKTVGNLTAQQNINDPFKVWLRDTLLEFQSWRLKPENGITKKEVIVSDDSTALTTVTCYKVKIHDVTEQAGPTNGLITLLREYNELPVGIFSLRFKYELEFYPSTIVARKYDFVYDIKDIEVSQKQRIVKYSFIRGRLANKEECKLSSVGDTEIIKTDFIWKGNKLIKKQLK